MDLFTPTGNWIEALGKTLIHSLWVALFLLSLLRILLHAIPDRLSNLRYRISLISMLVLVGSIAGMFFLLYAPGDSFQYVAPTERKPDLLLLLQKEQIFEPQLWNSQLLFVLCTYFYLAGIPVILIRSTFAVRYLRRKKASGIVVPEHWHSRFEQLKVSLGIRRAVSLLETHDIKSPAVIGFIKPAVLVPAGMFANLSVSQVETILLHELYHLRRFDTLLNVMQVFVENLLFYNPAVWAVSRIIRQEREKCCDDSVLASCGDPLMYAKALYLLAGQDRPLGHLAPGASGSDQFQLLSRIKRILNQHTMKNNIREKLFSLLLFAGGVLVLLTVTGFSAGFSIVKYNEGLPKTNIAQPSDTLSAETLSEAMAVPTIVAIAEPIPEAGVVSLPEPVFPGFADTVPELSLKEEAMKEIDWEELREELEEARIEALEEIDWDKIKQEIEEARLEAMAEIDWEAMKKEMEEVRVEVFEKIDWEEIKKDMEHARAEALEEIDWDEIRMEMEGFRMEMDSLKMDMDFDFDLDIDIDKIQEEVHRSMEEIDWEGLEEDMARAKIHLDSMLRDMDFDFDFDVEVEEEL